ncbi:MAG: nucleoside triphosphate pyrophosphohydrolase [Dehalococcoidia bacterium]
MTISNALTIVGIGPGDPALLTVEARDVLSAAPEVWLRTSRHPTVPSLPVGPRYSSFDDVYDRSASFEKVYATIVARVLELARQPHGVVYAVPGHPLFGEATVRALLDHAASEGLAVRIVAGVSFVDASAVALGFDPLAQGLLLLDALSLGEARRMLIPQRPALIAQVYDRRTASLAKLALLAAYPPEHPVRIVRAADGAGQVTDVRLEELDRTDVFDHLCTLYVPPLAPTDDIRTFEGLRAVIARLRAPEGGCPWDLQQTHETLKRYLLEEAYEAIDALDEGDPHRLAEELGDLLMQVVLHAQVAEDEGTFVIEDVLASITAKLIRRHSHVFGDVVVEDAHEVLRNWEQLKKDERGDAPLLDAVPKALPALAQAQAVQSRAEREGHHAPALPEARIGAMLSDAVTAEAFGELLFALVNLARRRDIDAEEALRLAVRRFRERVADEERARKPAV